MNSRAKARAERMKALLNDDGTITPAAHFPDRLLIQEINLEMEYLKALTAESVGEELALRVCTSEQPTSKTDQT